jgi:hypothetical protein
MLECCDFQIWTNHKPLTFAFNQKKDNFHRGSSIILNFVSHFTTDNRHIPGQDNVFAGVLSRVEAFTDPVTHTDLAASQEGERELQSLLVSDTA